MVSFGLIILTLTTILTLTLLTTPVKAARFDIQITWNLVWLTDSYDSRDRGTFMVQIKYYDDGWDMKKSSKHVWTVLEPGYFHPADTFMIEDVTANYNIYFRMVEVDWGALNDQIVTPFIDDSGSGITQGSWISYEYLETDFIFENVSAMNIAGDEFWLTILNMG